METVKKVYRQNKLIVISAVMLVLCSEILCTILKRNSEGVSFIDIAVRLICLAVSTVAAYRFGGTSGGRNLPVLCAALALITVWTAYSGLITIFGVSIYLFPVCAFICVCFLSEYYVKYCTNSLLHSLIYIALGVLMFYNASGDAEAYFITVLQIALFIRFYNRITDKRLKIINIIYTVISAVINSILIVSGIYNYINYRYEEGQNAGLIENVIKTLRPFGKSEGFEDIADLSRTYNLIRISGYFGYVVGIMVFVLLTVFVLSVFFKVLKRKGSIIPVIFAAVSTLGVNYVAGIFVNSGIVLGNLNVDIPVLSGSKYGYIIVGILLGMIFALDSGSSTEKNRAQVKEER